MIPLIAPADMRDMERRFFRETGTTSIDLMEAAARRLCDAIIERYGTDRTVAFACGPGGNGGDGFACARMYREAGGRAWIVMSGLPTSPDAIENMKRAERAGVAIWGGEPLSHASRDSSPFRGANPSVSFADSSPYRGADPSVSFADSSPFRGADPSVSFADSSPFRGADGTGLPDGSPERGAGWPQARLRGSVPPSSSVGSGSIAAEGMPERPDIWVDALYGTGLSRAPSGPSAALIERINADREKGSAVVAVDIPSGLNGLTGRAYEPCVRADLTCTFQYVKPGCLLADGLDMAGEVLAVDIGIPPRFYPEESPALMTGGDVRGVLPPRPRNIHKGSAGHLLIVAGSAGMAGAAALCAMSALRSGAGLVTIACPASIVPILQTLAPCAMCVPMPEADGALSGDAAAALADILPGKTAVACGCGLSRRASPDVVGRLMACGLPALFDADALNLIAGSEALRGLFKPHHLITPHPGEAARLLGHCMENPIADAMELKSMGCQALLKGAATVIPVGKRAVISSSGASGMAKGGSGDCLSGLAGGLMAQLGRDLTGKALAMCAAAASELHGAAGEIACEKLGSRGMTALDLIDALPAAFLRHGC